MNPELQTALDTVFDLAGLDTGDETPSWYTEPTFLDELYPDLPKALYELAKVAVKIQRLPSDVAA